MSFSNHFKRERKILQLYLGICQKALIIGLLLWFSVGCTISIFAKLEWEMYEYFLKTFYQVSYWALLTIFHLWIYYGSEALTVPTCPTKGDCINKFTLVHRSWVSKWNEYFVNSFPLHQSLLFISDGVVMCKVWLLIN